MVVKSIFISIFSVILLSNFAYGSDSENETDYEVIKFTQEDQNSINSELIQAAQQLNLGRLQQALCQGANPNYQDNNGNTAWHHVEIQDTTIFGSKKIKQTLYKHEASQTIANKAGLTTEDLLKKKIIIWSQDFAETAADFLRPPKPLPDGSFEAVATIVGASVIEATAEYISDDNDEN